MPSDSMWVPPTTLPTEVSFGFEGKAPEVSLRGRHLYHSCGDGGGFFPNRNTQHAPPIWSILLEAPGTKPRVNPAEWKRYEYRGDSSSSDGCGFVRIACVFSFFKKISDAIFLDVGGVETNSRIPPSPMSMALLEPLAPHLSA